MRRSLLLFATVAIVLAATTSLAKAADLDTLYRDTKDKRQTQVVVYTPYGNLQPVWDAFGKAYPGITVQPLVISGGGAPILARVAAEAASGNHVGDIVLSGLGDIGNLLTDNRLAQFEPEQANTLDPQFRDANGYFTVPFNTLFTLVYNPRLITEDQLPATLSEAASDRYAGKLGYTRFTGAASPDLVGGVLSFNDAITDLQLQAIKAHGRASPTAAGLLADVAQGRVVLGLWGPTQNVPSMQRDGAPIRVKYLVDSAVIMGPGMALLRNAPHEDAAKLLESWLLAPDGQAALSQDAASYGTQPGTKLPPGLPELTGYTFKAVPWTEYESRLKAFRARTTAVFGP